MFGGVVVCFFCIFLGVFFLGGCVLGEFEIWMVSLTSLQKRLWPPKRGLWLHEGCSCCRPTSTCLCTSSSTNVSAAAAAAIAAAASDDY